MMNNEHEDPPVDGGYTGLSRNAPPSAERWPHRAPTDETEVLRQRLLDYGDANVKMQARVRELEAELSDISRAVKVIRDECDADVASAESEARSLAGETHSV